LVERNFAETKISSYCSDKNQTI